MHRPIKSRAPDQRPRERLLAVGAAQLSDEELVAVILGGGTTGASALDLARELLADGLPSLAARDADELRRRRGLGAARTAQLLAAFELGRRAVVAARRPGRRLTRPEVAYEGLRGLFAAGREEIWVVFLDGRLAWRGERRLASGGVDFATLAPADVLRAVLSSGFRRYLVAHNHPSGDPTPSADDVRWTEALGRASEVVGLELVDHLVIGQGGYTSLRTRATGKEPRGRWV
jgi:DNA repair protein RadC